MFDKQPTIARVWKGRTWPDIADEYEQYNYDEGVVPLREKALGVQTFREDHDDFVEFTTISYWEDIPSMARFTGGDPTVIHHLDRDAEYLIELPERVTIMRIRHSHGSIGQGD